MLDVREGKVIQASEGIRYSVLRIGRRTRVVKQSKRAWCIWEPGHGWAMLCERTVSQRQVKKLLAALMREGSI